MEGQYSWLVKDIKPGTTAIDIGANIGDSAFFLAMQARIQKIYAYEPYPYLYNQARRYLRRSPFKRKIVLKNAGIADSPRSIHVPPHVGDLDSKLKNFKHGKKINVLAVNKVLANLRRVIIKCDAEGSEHTIFTMDTELRYVYRLQIEYHQGLQNLPNILKHKGFKVKIVRNTHPECTSGEVGWIYATR